MSRSSPSYWMTRPSGVSSTCEPPGLHAAASRPAPETTAANHARRDIGVSREMLPAIVALKRTHKMSRTMEWSSFLSHLECTSCGLRHDADKLQTVCTACGKVLFARYDLAGVRAAVKPGDFAARRWNMWRYNELLPIRDESNVISLGEGVTPLVHVRKDACAQLGL